MIAPAFRGIVGFDLRQYFRRISTYLYFGIFFAFAFLMVNAIGGAWESVNMAVGGSSDTVKVNSPYVLMVLSGVVSTFGVLVTTAMLGNAVYRDFETGIHPLFFTTPVSRRAYLGGRFTAAFLTNAFVLLSIPAGLALASVMPYLDRHRFGTAQPIAFLQPYLVLILPNLVFTSGIFFGLAAVTRQMMPNYMGGAILLVGYLLAGNLMQDIENERLAALLDPFGLSALQLLTKYWSPAERNTLLASLSGEFLYNRALWVGVGLAVLGAACLRFRSSHQPERKRWRRARQLEETAAGAEAVAAAPLKAAAAPRRFDLLAGLRQYLSLTRRSFWSIVGNRYFFAIVGTGLLFLVFSASQVGKLYGTTTWPVTYQVLEVLGGTFAIFVLIVITFYAGDLVWRDRDVGVYQVRDAMPVPNWVPLAATFTALVLMVVVLQTVILAAGILTQAVKGYTRFELDLYVTSLFGLRLVDYALLVALVVLVQVLVNHKYMGHLIVVLYFVFTMFQSQLGLEHGLYQYGSDAGTTYSDMNRFGPFLTPFWWFKAYWAGWALFLAVLSNLFWVRGQETGARWRARMARSRLRGVQWTIAAAALLLTAVIGGFIFYNTNVLNEYRTSHDQERLSVDYEKAYKQYEGLPQPRIVGVRVDVDLYPDTPAVSVRGEYRIANRTTQALDAIHIRIPHAAQIRRLELSVPSTESHQDLLHGYYIYTFDRALDPGQEAQLRFDVAYVSEGFANTISNPQVVENGTFINSTLMPAFGYDPRGELGDDATRRKYGLAPKPRMPAIDDEAARSNNYISVDSDWVDFEATVSTSPDQIAVAPGYLQREWSEGNRRYFHYKMDAPILHFYSFLSARYQVKRDRWEGPAGENVAIEIYYHPGHEYNVERMIDAVKKSLLYFTTAFGPYQHRQVRILEFPRYASFAQSFPNTIPYSESIGFIARIASAEDIDYPFYVTAHEVAHQWWAHQVIGGNVQGATVLSETLSQYSALLVMEREYGVDQMKKFLKYELDNYLTGRAFERKKELPLITVENQPYIHYRKGSLVMYALRDYLGEDRVNRALARFLADKKYQQPPYTTSRELVSYIRAETPADLQHVIEDLFEHITLYDNRAREATVTKTSDGRQRVVIQVEARKFRADEVGNENEVAMNDLVDVGVFAAAAGGASGEGKPLYLAKHRLGSGPQQIEVIVDGEPARAGVDPYNKLIDRVSRDNTVAVSRPETN
jgi:ABC-type transport system involved in multi-copper enzyme maturation permease subunit